MIVYFHQVSILVGRTYNIYNFSIDLYHISCVASYICTNVHNKYELLYNLLKKSTLRIEQEEQKCSDHG